MMNIKNFLKELEKIGIPDGSYVIYGSGPLGARELREIKDLDVAVEDKVYDQLTKKYPEKPEKTFSHIVIGNLDLLPARDTLIENFDQVVKKADRFYGHRFVNLEDLIRWKKKMGRPKDLADIKLIQKLRKSR